MGEQTENPQARTPEADNSSLETKVEGVEPKFLREKAEHAMKILGYRVPEKSSGRFPKGYSLPDRETHGTVKRAQPDAPGTDTVEGRELFDLMDRQRQELMDEQSKKPLDFAKVLNHNRLRANLRKAYFKTARDVPEGRDSAPTLQEFDEGLVTSLTDFDDEMVYDFLSTVQRYADYAEEAPTEIRNAKLRLWEKTAAQEIDLIENVASMYARMENVSIWKARRPAQKEKIDENVPLALEEIRRLLGTDEGKYSTITLKVWNENGKNPRVIERKIEINESLLTDPTRDQDLSYVKDACRQLIRATVGQSVEYTPGISKEMKQEADKALQPKNLRERIAKFLGSIIVGTMPTTYKARPSDVRMPHAMYGQLLTEHIGFIHKEGVPEFNPNNKERVPLELQKLADLMNAINALSEAQEENAHYTMGVLLRQTMDLLTPEQQKTPELPDARRASMIVKQGDLQRASLPQEVREGLTVDQPGDNLAALGNFLDVAEKGFAGQFSLVEAAEKNIDKFNDHTLVQAMEILNDWKVPLMKYLKYAPPNFILSHLIPDIQGISPEAEAKIIALREMLDRVKKRNENLKKGLHSMKEALQKNISTMRKEKEELQTLQTERKGLLARLHASNNEDEQRAARAGLEKNAETIQARGKAVYDAQMELCRSFTRATDASLQILGESQVFDSYLTSRDKASALWFTVSAYLFTDWVFNYWMTVNAVKGTSWLASWGAPGLYSSPAQAIGRAIRGTVRYGTLTPKSVWTLARGGASKVLNRFGQSSTVRSAATQGASEVVQSGAQAARSTSQVVDAVADAARAAQELEVAAKNIRTFDELKEVMDTAMKMKKWGTAAELLNTQSKLISAEAKAGNEVAKRLLNISHAVNVGKYAPPIICIAIDAVMFGVNEYDISLAKESGNRGIVDTLEARRTVRIRQGLIGGAMLAAGPYGLAVLPSYIAGGYIADKVTDSAVDWQRRAKDWLGATPQELLTKLKELPVGTTTFSHTMAVGTPLIPRLWKNWDKTSEQVGMEEYEDVEAINKTMRQALLGAYFMKTCEVEVLPTDSEDIKQRKVTEAIQDRIDFVGKMTAGTYDVSNAGAALFTSADSYANLMAMNRTLVRANAESKVIKYLSKTGEEKELDLSILTYAKKKNENSNADTKESLEFFKALREYEQEIAPFKKLMRDQARQAEIEAKMEARRKMQEETAAQNKVNFEKGNREANEKKNPAFQRRSAEVMLPKARRDSFTSVPDLWDRSEQRMTLADQDGKQVVLTYANFTNGPSISAAPQNGRNMPSNMPTFRVEGQNRVVQATPETLNGGADAALLREALITPIDGRSEESLSKVLNVFPFDVIVSGKRTSTSRGTLLRTLLPMYEKMKTPSEQRFFLNELLQQLRSYKGGLTWEASRKITLKFQDPTYQKVLGIKE